MARAGRTGIFEDMGPMLNPASERAITPIKIGPLDFTSQLKNWVN